MNFRLWQMNPTILQINYIISLRQVGKEGAGLSNFRKLFFLTTLKDKNHAEHYAEVGSLSGVG